MHRFVFCVIRLHSVGVFVSLPHTLYLGDERYCGPFSGRVCSLSPGGKALEDTTWASSVEQYRYNLLTHDQLRLEDGSL